MKQLSGIDASFLNMETSSVFGHVARSTSTTRRRTGRRRAEATKQMILERIDQLAPFRRRLVEVPLGLDLPYWIEDPDFDIDFHVRHHAVPPPGTPEQLGDVVSRIQARPLDRSKPLWELYVIEGVDDGRLIAQLTKVHHATIDGAAGAKMLAVDPRRRPRLPARPASRRRGCPTGADRRRAARAHRSSSTCADRRRRSASPCGRCASSAAATRNGGLLALADLDRPADARAARRAPAPPTARQRANEVDNPPALPPTAAPRTPWNAIDRTRTAASPTPRCRSRTPRSIRRAVGCTFNDVVMALCSGTLRRYLQKHDCLPDEPLIAMVPVSVRSGDEADIYQNRVSGLLADLATNEPDPASASPGCRRAWTGAKTNFKAIPAETLQDFTQFAPPAIAARAMRMYSRLQIADRAAPPFNLIISNVPGPATRSTRPAPD